jgi:hypothetical protein
VLCALCPNPLLTTVHYYCCYYYYYYYYYWAPAVTLHGREHRQGGADDVGWYECLVMYPVWYECECECMEGGEAASCKLAPWP